VGRLGAGGVPGTRFEVVVACVLYRKYMKRMVTGRVSSKRAIGFCYRVAVNGHVCARHKGELLHIGGYIEAI